MSDLQIAHRICGCLAVTDSSHVHPAFLELSLSHKGCTYFTACGNKFLVQLVLNVRGNGSDRCWFGRVCLNGGQSQFNSMHHFERLEQLGVALLTSHLID